MRSGHAVSAIAPVVCAGVGVRYGNNRPIRLASFRLSYPDAGLGIVTSSAAGAALLDLLSGRTAPAYGAMRVLGRDVTTPRGRAAVRREVGIASRHARILPAIRIRGHVERAARLAGQPASDRHLLVAAILDRLALTGWSTVPLRAAPELIARKAKLAAACVHQPRLLLIDGLLDQLSERDLAVLADVIADLRRDTAVLAVGRDADALRAACGRVLALADGILVDREAAEAAVRLDARSRRALVQ
jgi:ABC-type multidrug transport system ATPase subunit